jgi:hypothetical protein
MARDEARGYLDGMTELKRPYGRYRWQMPESESAFAYVSDGTLAFDIDEATYRMRSYLPAFDALPTKEEHLQNGGKLA